MIADFDDQRWPINLVILMLAGFVAGVLVTTTHDFNDPRLLYNGWVRLGSVVLLVGVLFWTVTLLQGQVRRRVQLCVLLSLLVHLGLAVFLHDRYLVARAQRERSQARQLDDRPDRVAVPDYHWQAIEEPAARREFDKPVQTRSPAEPSAEVLKPQEVEQPLPRVHASLESERLQPKPDRVELRRVELTAPHRQPPEGRQISRQLRQLHAQPQEPIRQPAIEPQRDAPSTLQPQVVVRRQQAAPATRERAMPAALEPETTVSIEPRAVARPARSDTSPDPTREGRSLPARQPRPAAAPTAAEAVSPIAAVRAPQAELRSAEPPVRRRATAVAPAPSDAEAEQRLLTPAPVQAVADRPRRSEETPPTMSVEPERLARATREESSFAVPPPTAAVSSAIGSIGSGAPASPPLEPHGSAVTRAAAVPVPKAAVDRPGHESAATGGTPRLAPRAMQGGEPSIGTSEPAARLARSARGIGLPAATIPDAEAAAGTAGVVRTQGGEPSRLEVGVDTGVFRAPAEAPIGTATVAAGIAKSEGGSGIVVAAAGPVRSGGESLPVVAAGAPDRPRGRSPGRSPALRGEAEEGLATTASPAAGQARPPADGTDAPGPAGLASSVPRVVDGIHTPQAGRGGGVAERSPSERLAAAPLRRAIGVDGNTEHASSTPAGGLPRALGNVAGLSLLAEAGRPGSLPGQAGMGEQGIVAAHAGGKPQAVDIPAGSDVGTPSRREGRLPVLIAAVEGPGGLNSDRTPVVGIPNRPARPESEVVHAFTRRFLIERSAGRWTLEGKTLESPAEAFQQRDPHRRAEIARKHGGGEATERAVEMGLDFLARNQFSDGRWCLDRFPNPADASPQDYLPGEMNADTAATGLALLSFLGAGYTHLDDKHQGTVRRGLQWLIANQQSDGRLFTRQTDTTQPARSYGHGIASIALCEAYGMTRDPELRQPAQAAVRYIVEFQDPSRGGWRYTQPDDAPAWYKESDTSVSGWMLMALKSAQMAGLEVSEESLGKVSSWLDRAQVQNGALYVYNPEAALTPSQVQGRSPNRAMTAEGLVMRLYLGWRRDHPGLIAGAEYLKANLPAMGPAQQPLRDSYYWYYATQVMFQMQGDYWTTWNEQLRTLLEPSQVTAGPLAGSWHPRTPQSDRWAHAGGRLYVTTLNLLMLEVYYRHLPLFQTLGP